MTQVSHCIVISGMSRCTDSVTSSIFHNFNVDTADALDVLSVHVGDADVGLQHFQFMDTS